MVVNGDRIRKLHELRLERPGVFRGSLVFVDGDIQSVFLRRLAQSIVSLAWPTTKMLLDWL